MPDEKDVNYVDPKPGTMLSRWWKRMKIKIDFVRLVGKLFELMSILFSYNASNDTKKKELKRELTDFLKKFDDAPITWFVGKVRIAMEKVNIKALDDEQEKQVKDALAAELYKSLDEAVDKFIDNMFDDNPGPAPAPSK